MQVGSVIHPKKLEVQNIDGSMAVGYRIPRKHRAVCLFMGFEPNDGSESQIDPAETLRYLGWSPETGDSLEELIKRQRAFSIPAFGPGKRTKGIIEHIKKELVEIEEAPTDVEEWIDVVLLGLDGAQRTGAEPSEIVDILLNKLRKNENRAWPDWRELSEDVAIEHIEVEV